MLILNPTNIIKHNLKKNVLEIKTEFFMALKYQVTLKKYLKIFNC